VSVRDRRILVPLAAAVMGVEDRRACPSNAAQSARVSVTNHSGPRSTTPERIGESADGIGVRGVNHRDHAMHAEADESLVGG
jgi:hypothetical protein